MNSTESPKVLELTDEMVERNDEIDNAVYELILTLTEKTDDELPWNMEMIGTVTDAVKNLLWEQFKLTVRHPAVVTNEDGSQHYSDNEWDADE